MLALSKHLFLTRCLLKSLDWQSVLSNTIQGDILNRLKNVYYATWLERLPKMKLALFSTWLSTLKLLHRINSDIPWVEVDYGV